MPKIPDAKTWEKAEIIAQPAYIRLVDNLRKYVEDSDWESEFEDVSQPYPGHAICLKRGETEVRYNLASLCFQLCFSNFDPVLDVDGNQEVDVDATLFDPETGDVDWHTLEAKTQAMLNTLFAELESTSLHDPPSP